MKRFLFAVFAVLIMGLASAATTYTGSWATDGTNMRLTLPSGNLSYNVVNTADPETVSYEERDGLLYSTTEFTPPYEFEWKAIEIPEIYHSFILGSNGGFSDGTFLAVIGKEQGYINFYRYDHSAQTGHNHWVFEGLVDTGRNLSNGDIFNVTVNADGDQVTIKKNGASFADISLGWDIPTGSVGWRDFDPRERGTVGQIKAGEDDNDTQAPTTPTGLIATADSQNSKITLTWNSSSDNVSVLGYLVYTSTSANGNYETIPPTSQNPSPATPTSSYVVRGLSPGTYYYKVQAVDGAANMSALSNYAGATITSGNSAPGISGVPDIQVSGTSGSQSRIIDLFNYASDDESAGSQLSFSLTQTNASLINCSIESNRYVSCNAPSQNTNGTNTITIRVEDPQGASASDSANITVNRNGNNNGNDSDAPRISGLPDVRIPENAGDRSRVINLFSYASDDEDSDSELDFRISRQSDTSLIYCFIDDDRYLSCEAPREDETGTSTITIEVEDTDGQTDSDTLTVRVESGSGSGSSGVCGDIDIGTRTIFMDELDSQLVTFDARNLGNDYFEITDVSVSDNSTYLTVSDEDFDRFINADDTGQVELRLRSLSVSGDREATVTVKLRGKFRNGNTCGFSEITETFRVWIQNNGSGSSSGNSGVCGDIELSASNLTVPENSRKLHTVRITNGSSRSFTISSVNASETNQYFSARVDDYPRSSISAGNSEDIELRIDAENVSSDRSGDIEVRVSGRFSDGRSCSGTNIRETFRVTVDDNADGTTDGGTGNGSGGIASGSVNVTLDKSSVALNKGETKSAAITVYNGLGDSTCISLSASSQPEFDATLSNSSICLTPEQTQSVTLSIRGKENGSGTSEIRSTYGNKTRVNTLNVQVNAARPSITAVTVPETTQGNATIVLRNNGTDLANVEIDAIDLPEGLSMEKVSKGIWRSGEDIQITLENNGYEGNLETSLFVASDSGNTNIPLQFGVTPAAQETGSTGLLNLVTTIGLALGLIIVLALVIAGIMSIFGKKADSGQ